MARTGLAPRLHGPYARVDAPTKGLGHVRPVAHRSLQVSRAVPAQRRTGKTRHYAVQGYFAGASRAAARLSRVPLRLSLRFLRRDPAELHPDAEFDIVGVPEEHEVAGSVHAEFEGRYAAGDQLRAEGAYEFCLDDHAGAIQEGFGFVFEGQGAGYVLVGIEEQFAGNCCLFLLLSPYLYRTTTVFKKHFFKLVF